MKKTIVQIGKRFFELKPFMAIDSVEELPQILKDYDVRLLRNGECSECHKNETLPINY